MTEQGRAMEEAWGGGLITWWDDCPVCVGQAAMVLCLERVLSGQLLAALSGRGREEQHDYRKLDSETF